MQAHPSLMLLASASNWLPRQRKVASIGSTDQIAGRPSAYPMAMVGCSKMQSKGGGPSDEPWTQGMPGVSVEGNALSGRKSAKTAGGTPAKRIFSTWLLVVGGSMVGTSSGLI